MSIGRFGCRDITARLVAIATLPAFLLFVAIVSTLYVRMLEDVREDVSERGRFTAVALAESSRYGVISGNTAVLERALKAVIDSEPSIAAIVVEDAGHRLTTVGDDKLPFVIGPFEAPMHTDVPNVDLFDEGSAPHLAQSAEAAPRFSADAVAGYVLVYTQIEPLLKERRRRLWLAVALVGLATVLSGLAGLILAQRLRAPLNAVMTALLQIREGRFDVALPETSRGDIADLNRAVNEMAKAMNRTHQGARRSRSTTYSGTAAGCCRKTQIDRARERDCRRRTAPPCRRDSRQSQCKPGVRQARVERESETLRHAFRVRPVSQKRSERSTTLPHESIQ